MPLNKWRSIKYLDDGVSEFQCLFCKGTWTSTNSPDWAGWIYCPLCGTKWEGKHECREHKHKSYDYYNKMTEEQTKNRERKIRENECSWEIQRRVLSDDGTVLADWEWYYNFEHDYPIELYKDKTPLRKIKFAAYKLRRVKELNKSSQKDDLGFINEYRLAMMKPIVSDNWNDYNKKIVVRVLV